MDDLLNHFQEEIEGYLSILESFQLRRSLVVRRKSDLALATTVVKCQTSNEHNRKANSNAHIQDLLGGPQSHQLGVDRAVLQHVFNVVVEHSNCLNSELHGGGFEPVQVVASVARLQVIIAMHRALQGITIV